jgi:hypothetical protein
MMMLRSQSLLSDASVPYKDKYLEKRRDERILSIHYTLLAHGTTIFVYP